MKFTEGAFRDWGYQLAKERFASRTVAEADVDGQKLGDRVLVVGAGPIGLFTTQACRAAGAAEIWQADLRPERLRLARVLGAAKTLRDGGLIRMGRDEAFQALHVGVPLRGVAIRNRLYFQRVQLAKLGNLVERQRGVVQQPDGGRLRHQGCCGRHDKISSMLRPPLGEASDHR
jgi:hypothetical protein